MAGLSFGGPTIVGDVSSGVGPSSSEIDQVIGAIRNTITGGAVVSFTIVSQTDRQAKARAILSQLPSLLRRTRSFRRIVWD